MKTTFLIASLLFLFSCNSVTDKTQVLQKRIDSLEVKLANTYKPGFGEFMSNIQSHHIKLWFAGKNENWKLADFEIHEIMESVDAIITYQTEREESKLIPMILPALDSVNIAIQKEDTLLFDQNFRLLTNTCNSCHKESDFEFNIVKIPKGQPFSNQEFKLKNH